MSAADGSIELFWGDGATRFRLAVAQLLALEEKFGCGAIEILDRFDRTAGRRWIVGEVREILRLGLLGAGHGMQRANQLVAKYCDAEIGVNWIEHADFAHVVLAAGLSGPRGDDVGKRRAATSRTGANASTPPRSTAPAQGSAGPRPKSTPARSSSSAPRSKAGTKAKRAKPPSIP